MNDIDLNLWVQAFLENHFALGLTAGLALGLFVKSLLRLVVLVGAAVFVFIFLTGGL